MAQMGTEGTTIDLSAPASTPNAVPTLEYASPEAKNAFNLLLLCCVLEIAALLFTLIAMPMVLWAARLPVLCLPLMMLGMLLWFITICCWASAMLIQAGMRWRDRRIQGRPDRSGRSIAWWGLRLAPVLFLVGTVVLLRTQVPRRVMFAVNRDAMDRWVQGVLAAPAPVPNNATVGAYEAYKVEPIPRGVRFLVSGSGFFRAAGGFAYSPDQPPPPCGAPVDRYTPLGGGWYQREYDGG